MKRQRFVEFIGEPYVVKGGPTDLDLRMDAFHSRKTFSEIEQFVRGELLEARALKKLKYLSSIPEGGTVALSRTRCLTQVVLDLAKITSVPGRTKTNFRTNAIQGIIGLIKRYYTAITPEEILFILPESVIEFDGRNYNLGNYVLSCNVYFEPVKVYRLSINHPRFAHTDTIIHPVVRGNAPCLGDAALSTARQLKEGNIFEVVELHRSLLSTTTVNPYRHLSAFDPGAGVSTPLQESHNKVLVVPHECNLCGNMVSSRLLHPFSGSSTDKGCEQCLSRCEFGSNHRCESWILASNIYACSSCGRTGCSSHFSVNDPTLCLLCCVEQ